MEWVCTKRTKSRGQKSNVSVTLNQCLIGWEKVHTLYISFTIRQRPVYWLKVCSINWSLPTYQSLLYVVVVAHLDQFHCDDFPLAFVAIPSASSRRPGSHLGAEGYQRKDLPAAAVIDQCPATGLLQRQGGGRRRWHGCKIDCLGLSSVEYLIIGVDSGLKSALNATDWPGSHQWSI